MNKTILVLLLVLVVLGGGVWFFKFRRPVTGTGYQAVFLSNGQVYFGKVKATAGNYLTLDDVYYLLVQRSLQEQKQATPSAKPQYTLRRLGGELHGPEERMVINRRHILFTEELKPDGKVVSAILESKKQAEQGK